MARPTKEFAVHRAPTAVLGALILCACTHCTVVAETGDSTADAPSEDPCVGLEFDNRNNRLDAAACSEIEGAGIRLVPADGVELCRRLSIDLLGTAPTDIEFEQACKWRSTAEIVDAFMSRPEYLRLNQRHWADVFRYTAAHSRWQDIADLDTRVAMLYAGELSLGEFAVDAPTHPGFLGRFDGVDLVGYSFLAFLGRDANPSERVALEPLWHLWAERDLPVPDPHQANARAVVLDTLRCAGSQTANCHSDLWGDETVIIEPPAPNNTDPNDPNNPNIIEYTSLTSAQMGVLRRPGELIVEHEAFVESYVDRVLERYFGYRLGDELPAVRQSLVALMVETGGDVRLLDREILTSKLYTATNNYAESVAATTEDWDPPYWHGPLKLMDAETWLATAAKLTGVDLGHCDHRYPEVQNGPMGQHPHAYPTLMGAPNYGFRDRARLLGGCPDQVDRFRELRTGVIAALTQVTITKELCGLTDPSAPIYPPGVVEDPNDKSEQALKVAVNQVYASALVKPIPADALAGVIDAIGLCRDDATCDPPTFAVETCRLVLKSADFIAY